MCGNTDFLRPRLSDAPEFAPGNVTSAVEFSAFRFVSAVNPVDNHALTWARIFPLTE
jgi:hypothetical protein